MDTSCEFVFIRMLNFCIKSNCNNAEKFESLGKYTKKNGCQKCCLLVLKDISAQSEYEIAELL